MTRNTLFACAAILSGLMAWGGHPASAQDTTVAGSYSIAPERSDDIAAAIDAAVEKMNFITRPIARGRLKKTNPAYQRIRISRSQADIDVAFDDRKPIRMPADGSTVKWTREDGEVFDVSAAWQNGRLEQSFKAQDGQRTNTFRLGEDGSTLTLDVVVTSEQLPAPVEYSLAYRRSQ